MLLRFANIILVHIHRRMFNSVDVVLRTVVEFWDHDLEKKTNARKKENLGS